MSGFQVTFKDGVGPLSGPLAGLLKGTKALGGGLTLDVQTVYSCTVRDLASRLHQVEDKLSEIMVQFFPPHRGQ